MVRIKHSSSRARTFRRDEQGATAIEFAFRYGTPEEVANLMLFLAGDEGRYCTGGVYMVDSGISAR